MDDFQLKWSLIICTYNPGVRLYSCIENLTKLNGANQAEVIIIDNNSNDGSIEKLTEFNWKFYFNDFRIIKELKQGLSFARFTGFRNASGRYILLIDDDNFPQADFLKNATNIFESDPTIGLIGGFSSLPVATICPNYLKPLLKGIAVGRIFEESKYLENGEYLWGACLCMRKEAIIDYIDKFQFPLFPDRSGNSLLSAGDGEIVIFLRLLGWKAYFSTTLFFLHDIEIKRLKLSYFLKLYYTFGITKKPFEYLVKVCQSRLEEKNHNIKATGILKKIFFFKNNFKAKDIVYLPMYSLLYLVFYFSHLFNKRRYNHLISALNERINTISL